MARSFPESKCLRSVGTTERAGALAGAGGRLFPVAASHSVRMSEAGGGASIS